VFFFPIYRFIGGALAAFATPIFHFLKMLNEIAFEYLNSINPIAAKFADDIRKIKLCNNEIWATLSCNEQEEFLNSAFDSALKFSEKHSSPGCKFLTAQRIIVDDQTVSYFTILECFLGKLIEKARISRS